MSIFVGTKGAVASADLDGCVELRRVEVGHGILPTIQRVDMSSMSLLDENKRLRYENRILREQLVCPKPRPMEGIPNIVLLEGLQMAWDYSMNGIEGVRCGHILAFGPATLMKVGDVKGRRGKSWSYYDANIKCEADRADLMKEMNQDGIHIILPCGQIAAGSFFARQVDTGSPGGSGHGAAQSLSLTQGSVVLKISADGAITEFRDGKKLTHCGSRKVNVFPTVFDNTSMIDSVEDESMFQSETDTSLSEDDVWSDCATTISRPDAESLHELQGWILL